MIFKEGTLVIVNDGEYKDCYGRMLYQQKTSKICWVDLYDESNIEKVRRFKPDEIMPADKSIRFLDRMFGEKSERKIKKILKVIRYKNYEVYWEIINGKIWNMDDMDMKSAYNDNGDYIGSPQDAYKICKRWGVKPEKIDKEHSVCSIGFCEEDKSWVGWSHRAAAKFEIGSKVKKGDCGYKPKDKYDLLSEVKNFWVDTKERGELVKEEIDIKDPNNYHSGKGVNIKYKVGVVTSSQFEPYPNEWGKGEWVAETLEDAKQMAIDFARGVS